MLLPQLSYIYWLIHFKANNVNGNSYIENNSTDSLKILLLLFDSFVHGTLLTRLSKLLGIKMIGFHLFLIINGNVQQILVSCYDLYPLDFIRKLVNSIFHNK